MKINDVLLKAKMTEKSLVDTGKGVYCFEVALSAGKYQIKQAVEKIYNVTVASVRTQIRPGKTKRVGRKMQNKTLPNIKTAIVIVKKGTIDIFPKTK